MRYEDLLIYSSWGFFSFILWPLSWSCKKREPEHLSVQIFAKKLLIKSILDDFLLLLFVIHFSCYGISKLAFFYFPSFCAFHIRLSQNCLWSKWWKLISKYFMLLFLAFINLSFFFVEKSQKWVFYSHKFLISLKLGFNDFFFSSFFFN